MPEPTEYQKAWGKAVEEPRRGVGRRRGEVLPGQLAWELDDWPKADGQLIARLERDEDGVWRPR